MIDAIAMALWFISGALWTNVFLCCAPVRFSFHATPWSVEMDNHFQSLITATKYTGPSFAVTREFDMIFNGAFVSVVMECRGDQFASAGTDAVRIP